MGSENIFVRKKRKKKKKILLARLRETVLEITVLMQSCQKQAVAGAARTGAQPGRAARREEQAAPQLSFCLHTTEEDTFH